MKNVFIQKKFPLISNLTVNIIVFAWVAFSGFDLYLAMLTFWLQNIAIGFVFVFRMIDLKKFSTEGVSLGQTPLKPTKGTKWFMIFLFVIAYSFFLFVYYKFFIVSEIQSRLDSPGTPLESSVFLGSLFFISHYLSYRLNKTPDTVYEPNIVMVVFYPFFRVLPIQVFLFSIMFGKYSFVVFGCLKISVDFFLEKYDLEKIW